MTNDDLKKKVTDLYEELKKELAARKAKWQAEEEAGAETEDDDEIADWNGKHADAEGDNDTLDEAVDALEEVKDQLESELT